MQPCIIAWISDVIPSALHTNVDARVRYCMRLDSSSIKHKVGRNACAINDMQGTQQANLADVFVNLDLSTSCDRRCGDERQVLEHVAAG